MAKQVHMKRPADWIEFGTSGAAAAQTVSHAAVTDSQHFLCGLSVSFSATGSALASIEMDDVVIWSLQIYDKEVVTFDHPIAIDRGVKVDLEIASGGGALVSKGSIWGYSD